jgi:hypothetical protein
MGKFLDFVAFRDYNYSADSVRVSLPETGGGRPANYFSVLAISCRNYATLLYSNHFAGIFQTPWAACFYRLNRLN